MEVVNNVVLEISLILTLINAVMDQLSPMAAAKSTLSFIHKYISPFVVLILDK